MSKPLKPLSPLAIEQITNILASGGNSWQDLANYMPTPAPVPALKSDVDSAFVKTSVEAILTAKKKPSHNAQTFLAQMLARATQYDTVRFSPKQWEWFNKLMLDAGVESIELPSLDGMGNPLDGGPL